MEIKILTENLFNEYDNFLLSNENNLFYTSSKYLVFLEKVLNCKTHVLIIKVDNSIIACLPLMYKDGNLGRVYNSLPFYGSNGGIISNSEEATGLLLKRYNEIVSDENVASSNYIENPLNKTSVENRINHNEEDFRIGQFTPLDLSNPNKMNNKDLLMQSLHTKTRNTIRKAIKSKVEINIDNESMNFVRDEHIKGMRKINGNAKSDFFFDNIFKSFTAGEDYNIFVAKKEGVIIAAVLVFYFNKTVEYFVPVTSEGYRNYQPNSLIIYEAMLDAMGKGFNYWNWGGTWQSQEGVYSFKNRWNTLNIEYTYYINITNKMVYRASKEDLIKDYYGFYLIPFEKLII
jgi:hypothetical protein